MNISISLKETNGPDLKLYRMFFSHRFEAPIKLDIELSILSRCTLRASKSTKEPTEKPIVGGWM